jgi:hypothetical protein
MGHRSNLSDHDIDRLFAGKAASGEDRLEGLATYLEDVKLHLTESDRDADARNIAAIVKAAQEGTSPTRSRRRTRRRRYAAVAFATLAGAAATALFVSSPWTSARPFLERAEAALTPSAGSILHYRWETEIPPGSGCEGGSHEIWIEQAPPYSYRARLTNCSGLPREIGGLMGTTKTVELVSPHRLIAQDLTFDASTDPVADLREAIHAGRAYNEGKARLRGRTVQQIRWECPAEAACAGRPSYTYIDPDTYVPVEDIIGGGFGVGTGERFDIVVRYSTFEYLPRTPANLALTDIRAQHPDAKEGRLG